MKERSGAIWALVDLFETDMPAGWRPRSIEFERKMAPVRAAGTIWDVRFSTHAGGVLGGAFEVVVTISQDDRHGAKGIPARRRLRLFEFVEAVEKRMWRLGYSGSFAVDRYDGQCSGSFHKHVKRSFRIRAEIKKVDSLRIGDRGSSAAKPRATRARQSRS